MNQVKIGKFIAQCRKNKNMTQAELAEKLNVSQQMIGQWETGKSNPKIETLRRIADTLEIGLWEIVELDQMDLDTRIQEIKKMVALLTPEGLEEFERLTIESINENQESIQKKQETTAVQSKEMLRAYSRLNNAGRKEAVKRVDELTELPRYTKPDEPINYVNAAHADNYANAPDELKQLEEDIMDDDNF